eukprot:TRINITY_DN15033_c0_g1_i4.p1 TRINITY_DN15033_c0_g1~~TRINITY_DN15033_c0_g1_i4.p1  ORF type:complete len:190 (+),score=47.81 TRINITY_DN15033_c0_g1_i4:133-702(+)
MIRRPPRSTQSRSSAASDVYKRQNPDTKLYWALGCSCFWIVVATALVITAVVTRFWYYGHATQGGYDLAYCYGVIQDCYYESNDGDSWDTKDSGWVCHDWKDTATHDNNVLTDECKFGTTVAYAFSLVGLIITFPVAIICMVVACCFLHDHRSRFKALHIVAICLLALGAIMYMPVSYTHLTLPTIYSV